MRSFKLQLYLTLMSLPILVYWGIPVSVMSPLGNIIFHPVLALFLLLSSLVFFCHVFCIPCGVFVIILQRLSHVFDYLLSYGSAQWLIAFTRIHFFFLALVPIVTCYIIVSKKTCSLYRSIVCLLVLICMTGFVLKYLCKPSNFVTSIACNTSQVKLIYAHNMLVLIDPGAIGQRISYASWVEYSLAPRIIQMTGSTTIDHVILMQPNQTTFAAVASLCELFYVKNLYMPVLKGQLSEGQQKALNSLENRASLNKTNITYIHEHGKITLGRDELVLHVEPKTIKSKKMEYCMLSVSGTVVEQKIQCFGCKSSMSHDEA